MFDSQLNLLVLITEYNLKNYRYDAYEFNINILYTALAYVYFIFMYETLFNSHACNNTNGSNPLSLLIFRLTRKCIVRLKAAYASKFPKRCRLIELFFVSV